MYINPLLENISKKTKNPKLYSLLKDCYIEYVDKMKRINVYVSSLSLLKSSLLLNYLSYWEEQGFTWDILFITDYLKTHKEIANDRKYLELLYKLPSKDYG